MITTEKFNLDKKMICHDLLNRYYGTHLPHEWYFLKMLIYELKDTNIAKYFLLYMVQYNPNYNWLFFDLENPFQTILLEASFHDMNFQKYFAELISDEEMENTKIFADIITEFLIRFCNYSLINCGGRKVIITSNSNCHKNPLFIEGLENGYDLHRLAKLQFIPTPIELQPFYPNIEGFYQKLPVLPTRDIHIPFKEAIEGSDGHLHEVLQRTPKENAKN